ncbi:dTDP-4-keto-6-deoxyhexose 4-ketoreductase [Saccharopolyspora shandongensis]|uniref:dTDP-4-keto-6-deoxyhexose 4-ketoreductase n=1 Tax=Saccharopolyspora shandongensis TaxID=418495 RepID=A0A1H2R203_9PSEU|nr:NAD-dependent epimerase/dehydratase [Saccharopolyspora shandongensis]SDW13496.1 dTDP-4-keto-6-deoxyhexose 4-ketoreductase [Saccharopolyspora shandongensis]
MPDKPLVVVLGASGFLGSAVTAALAGRPVRLRAVARREVAAPAGCTADFESRQADLTEPGALAEAVEGAAAVFPFAAQIRGASGWRIAEDDVVAERTNVGVIRELAEVLHGDPVPVVVFPGSNTQVGKHVEGRLDGTEEDRPEGTYDRQKLTAERILKEATAAGRLRGISLRLPPVFGPPAATADDRGVVSTMIRRALAGEPLTMWHDGTIRRDLLNVSDAARAFVAAMDHADALAGRHYLIGTGKSEPLGDVFRLIAGAVARHTGTDPVPVVSVPPPPHADGTDFRSVDVDPSAFAAATGWQCETPLAAAIEQTAVALATG